MKSAGKANGVPILDIRPEAFASSLLGAVRQALSPAAGQAKSLPTLLLYDEKGLKLFEDITYLDEYYLTNAEIDALTRHASEIAKFIPPGTGLIEFGSGNLRKVNILLQALEKAEKDVLYFALDLSLPELERTFSLLDTAAYKHVKFHGLHGTYDHGLEWLADPDNALLAGHTKLLMSLGSSIGNFTRDEAGTFLARFADVLNPNDLILIGLDACQDFKKVWHAYNDVDKVTEQFYRNGLDNANRILGYTAFAQNDWAIDTSCNDKIGGHAAAYKALKDISMPDYFVSTGDILHVEQSLKYSKIQSDQLWHTAGLIPQMAFQNDTGDHNLHLLSPGKINFAEKATEYAAGPLPSTSEWYNLWAAWDAVTKSMVPSDELLNKPIKLRNNLIFYLGHIPAFADIHFTKATSENPTEPKTYHAMFERGIDPDVDNPEMCHAHSEIPDQWPPLQEILDYQRDVRVRILTSYRSGKAYSDRKLRRGLWLAYEHEAMHLETFLYMLIQSDKVLPPPGNEVPDFNALSLEAAKARTENQWHRIPESSIVLGLEDPENDLGPDRYFGWDIERPPRTVSVKLFEAQSRSISNGEYARYLEATNAKSLPASWITQAQTANGSVANGINGVNGLNGTNGTNGVNGHSAVSLKMASSAFVSDKLVRTVYGPVPLKFVLDWPVMASYDELTAYARWAGGRIPTMEEARSIYSYVDNKGRAQAEQVPSKLISAVNGHLSNDGVEETPPSNGHLKEPKGVPSHTKDLFVDLEGCNIGFKHWHPTPVTGEGHRLRGLGDMGGLWEWTSTPLEAFEKYKSMDLYPGYSADFFDGKHHICLGGSWATVPRVAGRKTFINWYQHNYPYVWCTARLVRDVV